MEVFCHLNSLEHEIYPAHKYWHFNIYLEKQRLWLYTPEVFINFVYSSIYEQDTIR